MTLKNLQRRAPHATCTTLKDHVNVELLAFIEDRSAISVGGLTIDRCG
jgi:hypothetical protein